MQGFEKKNPPFRGVARARHMMLKAQARSQQIHNQNYGLQ